MSPNMMTRRPSPVRQTTTSGRDTPLSRSFNGRDLVGRTDRFADPARLRTTGIVRERSPAQVDCVALPWTRFELPVTGSVITLPTMALPLPLSMNLVLPMRNDELPISTC